jgi:hypothetical protein
MDTIVALWHPTVPRPLRIFGVASAKTFTREACTTCGSGRIGIRPVTSVCPVSTVPPTLDHLRPLTFYGHVVRDHNLVGHVRCHFGRQL